MVGQIIVGAVSYRTIFCTMDKASEMPFYMVFHLLLSKV